MPLFDFKSIADSQRNVNRMGDGSRASWRLLLSLNAMNQCYSSVKNISKQPTLASSNVKAGILHIVF